MGKKTRSGSEIPIRDEHHGSYFREIRNFFGGLKIFKFFDADQEYCIFDLGSGIRDPGWKNSDPGSQDKHTRSATLLSDVPTRNFFELANI